MSRRVTLAALAAAAAVFAALAAAPALHAEAALPPPVGADAPAVEPLKGDDGIYHQSWFVKSFLDLREDFADAQKAGKRFAVIFEQRGCIYCTKMHTEVLSKRYINDYVRENFHILSFDMWGAREVTDFDGTKLPEKKLAERWGVMFTPTVVFFKDSLDGLDGKWGQPLEVTRMSLGVGPGTFYDLFTWVRTKVYDKDRNFQRFHLERVKLRDEIAAKSGKPTD
jgi:hypothetical protein